MMRTFFPEQYSDELVVNHIDGDPSNNDIDNLELVTQNENMKHAAICNLMKKGEEHHNSKYSDNLIHQICQLTVQGYSRLQIRQMLNINGQLIDDVRSGRSHKEISMQYIQYGFEYNVYNKEEKDALALYVYELWINGYNIQEIMQKVPEVDRNFIDSVKSGRCYNKITNNYFSKY